MDGVRMLGGGEEGTAILPMMQLYTLIRAPYYQSRRTITNCLTVLELSMVLQLRKLRCNPPILRVPHPQLRTKLQVESVHLSFGPLLLFPLQFHLVLCTNLLLDPLQCRLEEIERRIWNSYISVAKAVLASLKKVALYCGVLVHLLSVHCVGGSQKCFGSRHTLWNWRDFLFYTSEGGCLVVKHDL